MPLKSHRHVTRSQASTLAATTFQCVIQVPASHSWKGALSPQRCRRGARCAATIGASSARLRRAANRRVARPRSPATGRRRRRAAGYAQARCRVLLCCCAAVLLCSAAMVLQLGVSTFTVTTLRCPPLPALLRSSAAGLLGYCT